jgi:hypothetical protein
MSRIFDRADDFSRRDFLALAARGLLGVTLVPALAGVASADNAPALRGGAAPRRPTVKNIIYLYMAGGMSHLDTFDTKPGAATQGPTETIKTAADGLTLSQHFPLLAKQAKRFALVRSLTSNQGAHEQGNYFMHTSYALRGTVKHPCLGAWMLRFSGRTNPTIPGNVVIAGDSNYPGAGYLDPAFSPLMIGNPNDGLKDSHRPSQVPEDQYQKRLEMLKAMNQDFQARYPQTRVKGYQDAYDEALALMKSSDLKAFDITDEAQAVRDSYGPEAFGQGCLLARRLVEHGVRYVEVNLGGWDTHTDNFDRVADNAAILDRGLGALLPDLASRGLLEETLVVVTTEFGRTPEITDNNGRNHYPKCFSGLIAGGGVHGGMVYGKTNETGAEVAENAVPVPDFNATIAWAAGLPLDEIVISPAGRPFTVADKGRPVTALFA